MGLLRRRSLDVSIISSPPYLKGLYYFPPEQSRRALVPTPNRADVSVRQPSCRGERRISCMNKRLLPPLSFLLVTLAGWVVSAMPAQGSKKRKGRGSPPSSDFPKMCATPPRISFGIRQLARFFPRPSPVPADLIFLQMLLLVPSVSY